jgi:cytochrome P450
VLGAYVVTRYEDVLQILGDPGTFSSASFFERLYANPPEVEAVLAEGYPPSKLGAVVNLDRPLHTRVRKISSAAFTPRRIALLEDGVRTTADELIDAMTAGTRADFFSAFAYQLPLRTILRMLDLPDSQGEQLHLWSDYKMALQWGDLDLEQHLEAARGFVEFQRYVGSIVAERRKTPGDDVISAIVHAGDDDGELLDEAMAVGEVMGFVNAGHGTVTTFLTIGLCHLLENRTQWEALCADPGLIPAAIEELLRFDAPVKQLFRKTTQAVTIGGVDIPEGSRVAFVMGSANRDEAVFTDPERLDVHAAQRPHLAFSKGIHFCLGAPLARLQGRVVFERLTSRLPSIRLVGDGQMGFQANIAQRIPDRLEVEWDRDNQ